MINYILFREKVADLDTTNYDKVDTLNKSYSRYIYIIVIFLIILCVLIWLKPSFLTKKDEKENKVYINKNTYGHRICSINRKYSGCLVLVFEKINKIIFYI